MPPKVSMEKLKSEGERLARNMQEYQRIFKEVPAELLNISDEDEPIPGEIIRASEMDEEMKKTVAFCKETERDTMRDKITVSKEWKREEIICQNEEHYILTDTNDAAKIEATLSPLDICLLLDHRSRQYDHLFNAALSYADESKREGHGPSLSLCLAWLSFAAQTPLEMILPQGEYFEFAHEHIKKNLNHPCLTKSFCKSSELEDIVDRVYFASIHICQVLKYLAVSKLDRLTPEKRGILLFAISRILLDKNLAKENNVKDAAMNLFKAIVTIDGKESKKVLTELGLLIPNLCEDLRGIRLIIAIIRQALKSPIGPISLLVPIFVNVSERGECAPDVELLAEQSNEEFGIEYTKLLTEMVLNIFEVFKTERSQQVAVIGMLDMALIHDLVEIIPEELITKLIEKLKLQQRQWKKTQTTDDYVVNDLLNVLLNRISEIPYNVEGNADK